MPRHIRYTVSPYENSTWCVRVDGENEGPQQFDTKAEATAYATTAASIHGHSQVIVQHVDGTPDDIYTFGDPENPEDRSFLDLP